MGLNDEWLIFLNDMMIKKDDWIYNMIFTS